MRIFTLIAVASLMLPLGSPWAAETVTLDDEAARLGYSLGYQIGGDFKRQGVEMDGDAVIKGMRDAISETAPMMSPKEMHATLISLKRKLVEEQRAREREAEIKNIADDKKFLEENGRKPGVITTKSGLQYKILSKGKGNAPAATDQVTVHYRGTLSNGQEFDNSHERNEPATFKLDQVIAGWQEGLQHIKEGGKIELVIPSELAYDRGPLEKRVLVFEVELIAVGKNKQSETTKPAASAAG